MGNQELRSITDLKPHPKNADIYHDGADDALIASIHDSGILAPLLITTDGMVISGHRRLDAAKNCNLSEIPATVFESNGSPMKVLYPACIKFLHTELVIWL